jgi:hypothetical protein
VIRWLLGNAFQRWGIPGLVCGLLVVWIGALWLVTTLAWLFAGVFLVALALAGFGYFWLLVFLVRWFRSRRQPEHLLMYGRKRWPE